MLKDTINKDTVNKDTDTVNKVIINKVIINKVMVNNNQLIINNNPINKIIMFIIKITNMEIINIIIIEIKIIIQKDKDMIEEIININNNDINKSNNLKSNHNPNQNHLNQSQNLPSSPSPKSNNSSIPTLKINSKKSLTLKSSPKLKKSANGKSKKFKLNSNKIQSNLKETKVNLMIRIKISSKQEFVEIMLNRLKNLAINKKKIVKLLSSLELSRLFKPVNSETSSRKKLLMDS